VPGVESWMQAVTIPLSYSPCCISWKAVFDEQLMTLLRVPTIYDPPSVVSAYLTSMRQAPHRIPRPVLRMLASQYPHLTPEQRSILLAIPSLPCSKF
jgi:hypothetical protein